MSKLKSNTFLIALLTLAASCSKSSDAQHAALPKSDLPEKFHLASAPSNAKPVGAVRSDAKQGDTVALAGRAKDFIDGLAVFTVTDETLKPCNEAGPMDTCPTPWDYCCDDPTDVAQKTVTVEFREGAEPMKKTVHGFHGLDHLSRVVVTGKAEKDAAGNLTVLADGVYVKP